MIFILAGSYEAAWHLAHYELKLHPLNWKYIERADKLYAWRSDENFVAFGYGFWERHDAMEILAIVAHRGFRVYEPPTSDSAG